MNKEIKELLELKALKKMDIAVIDDQLQAQYDKIFDDSVLIQEVIKRAENCDFSGYCFDESGWVDGVIDVDLTKFLDVEDYLREYLSNHCVYIRDLKTDYPVSSCGPSIVINRDGDVYDSESNKFIINKGDYENSKELAQLINKYQESQGVFNWIFECNYYDELFPFLLSDYIDFKEGA